MNKWPVDGQRYIQYVLLLTTTDSFSSVNHLLQVNYKLSCYFNFCDFNCVFFKNLLLCLNGAYLKKSDIKKHYG